MVATGSYRLVERVAIALGVFELAFLAEAWLARPEPAVLLAQLHHLPWSDHDFLYLAAANIGTCIMPWTIFYQQSALLDKGLGQADLKAARLDTLLGAALCQLITAAILIAAAQAFGGGHGGQSLDSVVNWPTASAACWARYTAVCCSRWRWPAARWWPPSSSA